MRLAVIAAADTLRFKHLLHLDMAFASLDRSESYHLPQHSYGADDFQPPFRRHWE